MSNIRVTYSGLIAFLVSFISVITGTFFVIIVTRRLSPDEFGLWTLVNNVLFYVLILDPIISYWTTRQIARGEKVGKSAVLTGSLFSGAGFVIFFIMLIFVSSNLNVNLYVLLLAVTFAPLNIISGILGSICLGYKPHLVSYGIFAFETSKPVLGFAFVYLLHMGIGGAFLAVILASTIRIIMLTVTIWPLLRGKIQKQIIKFWLRMSWLVAYRHISGIIFRLDVLLISVSMNSLSILAFWGATQTIGYVAINAGNIAQALSSKIIATGQKEISEEIMRKTMYFAIPITAASIVFAKVALNILNPLYVGIVYSVYLVSLASFFNVIRGVNYTVLTSYETVDVDKQSSFKEYVKSKLFLVPTLNYIYYTSYVALLAFFLFVVRTPQMSQIFVVSIWSLILFTTTVPFAVYTTVLMKRQYNIRFPYVTTIKYVVVATLSSIMIVYISQDTLEYNENISNFIPQVIPFILIGTFLYFGITYLIDPATKNLFRSIISEITKSR